MKKTWVLTCLFLTFVLSGFSQVDNILGKWKTIDDEEGVAMSVVNIYKGANGKYYGRIEKLFKYEDELCVACQGKNKNKPVLGMVIVNDMALKGEKLVGGTILDPMNGKVYYCSIAYNAKTTNLEIRGSIDKRGWVGRTQTWQREN